MMQPILADVRTACNLEANDTSFDQQLIQLTNTQIMMAHQFGIGATGFMIHGDGETWRDWLGNSADNLAAIKTWLGYSVLLLFDPPDNSTVSASYKDQIAKIEWMLKEKSEEKGYVKNYVPEKASFYEDDE